MEQKELKDKLKKAKSVLQIGALDISIIRDHNRLFKIGIDTNPKNRSFFNRFIVSNGNYIQSLNMLMQRVDMTIITLPAHEYNVNAIAKEAKRFTNGEVIILSETINIEESRQIHFKGIPQSKIDEIKEIADCYNLECKENKVALDSNDVSYFTLKPKKDNKDNKEKKKRKSPKPISEETRKKMREAALKRKKK